MEPKSAKMEPFQILLKMGTWSNLRAENPKMKVLDPQKSLKSSYGAEIVKNGAIPDFDENWYLE